MKKLVVMAVACAFVSTAAFSQVQQPQQGTQQPQQGTFQQQQPQNMTPPQNQQNAFPQQKQQNTYFPQQNNESTYPENQQKNLPRHRKEPIMSHQNGYNTVPSDTTRHPAKKDTSSLDTTQKADTSGVGH